VASEPQPAEARALEAAQREFLRAHPAEAKRQKREAKREARRKWRETEFLPEVRYAELPASKDKKPWEQKTSVQRAAAHARGEIENALREQTLSLLLGVRVPTKGKPTRLDMDRLEQAQRAASIVAAAREFYTELKRTFPRRLELEEKVGPIAGTNRRWLENYKAVCAQVRAGRATKRDLLSAASNPPPTPAVLRPLLQLAAKIPPHTGDALKDLAPERGPGAGGGWKGNIRLDVTAAGLYASGRLASVNHRRTAAVELLAPEYLDLTYLASPWGVAKAAKSVAAKVLNRSRTAVDAMVKRARVTEATEKTDTPKN
jgi:hypothetical protein